ncbi:MAG: hypothetical protein KDC98_01890 [Planctomycetes bacterium]|nr:hypothetical protein [Planctomycetota bacterium]
MTGPRELIDPIADEREDRALTEALLDEFAGELPEATEFAAGVRTRIEQPRSMPRALPGYLRAAAAMLPPVLVPKPLGAGLGGALAGKGIAKLLPGLAAFPVAVIAVLVVTLFMILRSLLQPAPAATAGVRRREVERELRGWWRQHAIAAGAVVLGLVVMMGFARVEAVALVMVTSSLALLAILGRLGRLGFATREEVARRAVGVLLFVGAQSFQLPNLVAGQAGLAWISPMLLLATIVCVLLVREFSKAGGLLLLLALVLGTWSAFGKVEVTVGQVRERIASTVRGDDQVTRLRDVARMIRHLRAAGEPLPDLTALGAAVHAYRDERLATMQYDHDALAVIELGLSRDSDWERWRNESSERRERRIMTGEVSGVADYRAIHSLAHRGLLTPELGHVIASGMLAESARLLAELGVDHDDFDDLVEQVTLCEAIGETDAVATMRDRAFVLLERRWLTSGDGRAGAFTSHRLSEDEAPGRRAERLWFGWIDSTSDAIELLARFGVPDRVDLLALARYLRGQQLRYRADDLDSYGGLAACALRRLESLPVYRAQVEAASHRLLLECVLDWRVFAAAALLGLFAVGVTWRARPASAVEVSGR